MSLIKHLLRAGVVKAGGGGGVAEGGGWESHSMVGPSKMVAVSEGGGGERLATLGW